VHQALIDELQRRRWSFDVEARYSRAVLRHVGDGERYLIEALPGRRRKEYRRKVRKLTEHGKVVVSEQIGYDHPRHELEQFVRLEGLGWKGEQGTAFRHQPASLAFLQELVQSGYRAGRVRFLLMSVGGRVIAAKINLHTQDAVFAFKIAFDPEYGRFSPGVLLELEAVRRVGLDPTDTWVDSCAGADHPLFGHLWRERRTIENLSFSARRQGDLVLSMRLLGRLARRFLRYGRCKLD
jgi:CelD/BcsL family acetyltransferase involved in cellulose biosynthesis